MRNKRRDTSAPIGPVGQAVPLPLPRDAAVQGQVTPLPLPRENDGEAVPLPLPRQGEGTFRPLPLPREGGDAPAPLPRREPEARDGKQGKGHAITQRVATEILDRAKEHHGRLNNVGAAFRIASREVGVRLYRREDGVYDLKPPTALERLVQQWAKGVKTYTPPAEPEDVTKLRRAWDEAARSGDPDRMTRAANDLIRAVTDARARDDMPAAREGDADPTRARSIGEQGQNVREGVLVSSDTEQVNSREDTQAPGWRNGEHVLGVPGLQEFGADVRARVVDNSDLGSDRTDSSSDRLGGAKPLGWWPEWLTGAGSQREPNRLKTKTVKGSTAGGKIVSLRNFELERASERGGYIIQEVIIIFRPRLPDGSFGPPRILFHFWEAWEVRKGAKSPWEKIGATNDSVKFERGAGGGGRVEIQTRTRFYEGLRSLPPQFKRNKPKGQPGYDPTIDPAGGLLATSRPFELSPDSYDSATPWENIAVYTDW